MALKNFRILDDTHSSLLNIDDLGYTFKSSFDTEADRIDTQHIFSINKMTYPQGGELSDLNVDFALTALDRKAFEGLVDIYQSNPTIAQADINTLAPLIETLFSRGFNIAMNDMHFKVAEEEFKSHWLLAVPEGTVNVSRDPSIVLPALTGNMDAYMSQGMANENPMLAQGIDELVVMEMVTEQDAGYQMRPISKTVSWYLPMVRKFLLLRCFYRY